MKLGALQTRKPWILGGVGAAVLLVALSWLLVIHPRLTSASDTQSQADNTDVQNTQLVTTNRKLAASQRNIATLRTQLVRSLEALPANSALPEFTNELTTTAAAAAVTLSDIGIGVAAPASAAAPTPAAAPASTDAAGSATPAPTAAAPAAATQYQINVTLSTHGPLANQLEFLKALQRGTRRVLVTSTLISGAGSKLTVTTQLNIFTAPMSTDQIAQLRKLLTAG